MSPCRPLAMILLVLASLASRPAAAAPGPQRKFTFGSVACSATSTGLDFAVYNPLQTTAVSGTGNVQVTCRLLGGLFGYVAATVSMTAGSSLSFASRQMRVGTNTLNYNLYWDAARSQIAGDGTGGSFDYPLQGVLFFGGSGAATQVVPVYGSIPPRQDVAPGIYRDMIVVTVSY